MKVIPIYIEAGISGFESPAAEYKELGLSLDQLLIRHPNATFIGQASGQSMQGVGIFDGDLLIVDRSLTARNGDVVVANYMDSRDSGIGYLLFIFFHPPNSYYRKTLVYRQEDVEKKNYEDVEKKYSQKK